MNNFQTILVAIFLAFFVFGVLVFSGVLNLDKKTGSNNISGNVVIWGTLPQSQVKELFETGLPGSSDSFTVKYVEQSKDTYESNLIDAFAKDKGPDLFILTPDMVLENNNFIFKIPYASFPKATFQSTFIDGADIFLSKDGVIGYPLLVDPLVLYFNKNILSNESILYPPKTWDEIFDFSGKLIKKNKDGTISQSMIALGQYDNVSHVKDIISLFLLQSGNPIVKQTDTGYALTITNTTTDNSSPFSQIISYLLEFSNPSNDSYTWNRSMPNSLDMFTSGKLAFYIGYASELFNIESVNPNLSFDVAMIPQTKGMEIKRTYGEMYTMVVSNKSKNMSSALIAASMFSKPDFLKEMSVRTSLPTATRSLLAERPEDPYLLNFFDSVIISRSWFDPDSKGTDNIFRELLENSLSNRLSIGEAINKASNQLELLLKKTYE